MIYIGNQIVLLIPLEFMVLFKSKYFSVLKNA